MTRLTRCLVVAGAVAAIGIGAAGCSKKPPQTAPPPPPSVVELPPPVPPPPPPPPPTPPPAPVAPPKPVQLTEDQLFTQKTLADLNAEKPLRDVFFDYDKSDLRDEGRAELQRNADWLKKWAGIKITIEGHCDSRGTPEYNLALGERRAAAALSYLGSLGIAAGRVVVVSKGKEQPFCNEENEACWSQNRRGHFIITAK